MSSDKFASEDPSVVSVYEIIGSYFTDTIFNHIYKNSREQLKPGSSITDEFRRRVQSYLIGVKNDNECYTDVIQGLHKYFMAFKPLGFNDFVDRVAGTCVPPDYYRKMLPPDRDEVLAALVCTAVADLVAYTTTPDMLRRIIDGHEVNPKITIRMMQDATIESMLTKRAATLNKFLRKAGQAQEHVSLAIVDDMKRALRRLVKEKSELTAALAEAEAESARLRRDAKDLRVQNAKALKLIKLLRAGRDEGPAAAAAKMLVPPAQRAGEPEELAPPAPAVPSRERLAERSLRDDGRPAGVPGRERLAERPAPDFFSRPAPDFFSRPAAPDFFSRPTAPTPEAKPAPGGFDMQSAIAPQKNMMEALLEDDGDFGGEDYVAEEE